MQVLELYFNPKAEKDKIFDSFCYEPEDSYEKRLGSLFIVGQVLRSGAKHNLLLDNLSSAIKAKYYALRSRSPGASLKQALKAGNTFLADLVKQGNVDWLGNLNLVIFSLKESQQGKKSLFTLNFSKVGKIKMFLIRQGQIAEIGKELEAQDIEPYPPKIFFHTASGRLEQGDRLVVATSNLAAQNYDLIQRIAHSGSFEEKTLKETVSESEQPLEKISGICLLTILTKETLSPMALTFAPEPEKFVWLKKIGQGIKTVFRKIPLNKIPLPRIPLAKVPLPRIALPKFFENFENRSRKILRERFSEAKKILSNKKFALIPVLILFLLLGYLIFAKERSRALKQAQELLGQVETKVLQAQNYLLLKDTAKANLLFQEAWQDIAAQASAGAPLKEKARELKESIKQQLWEINKIEKTQDPEVLPALPDISPYLAVFQFSQNDFALYLLDANSGQIIKYPYSLTLGQGEPKFWLIEKTPDIAGAKSIAVDGSIWVLAKDNSLHRFWRGLYQETLDINIWPALNNPHRIWTSTHEQNLYLLEEGRIIVLDKSGQLVKQYQTD